MADIVLSDFEPPFSSSPNAEFFTDMLPAEVHQQPEYVTGVDPWNVDGELGHN
jgi:hypothetical protein